MQQKLTKDMIIGENRLTHQEKIDIFEELLRSTNRQGMDNVIDFVRRTDFYTAPASSKYHSNYDNGLLDHSLCVYAVALECVNCFGSFDPETVNRIDRNSLIVSCLLHDFCKICFYKKGQRWKKDDTNSWVSYDSYIIEDTFPIGHGEKSVIMLQGLGLQMTPEEMLAIRYHMAGWGDESKEFAASKTNALKISPLVLLLQMADFSSSVLFERTVEN